MFSKFIIISLAIMSISASTATNPSFLLAPAFLISALVVLSTAIWGE